MKPNTLNVNREAPATVHNGWPMLVFALLLLAADIGLFVWSIAAGVQAKGDPYVLPFVVSLLGLPAWIVFITGFFTLQPNEARVLVLFGAYKGTVREAGFHWGNPFYSNGSGTAAAAAATTAEGHGANATAIAVHAAQAAGRRSAKRNRISLRARTLNGQRLKVNDKGGNPIEIAAVVIWRVQDTAMAMFDVDDYEKYVFSVIHAVDYSNSLHVFQTTELNLFIGRNYLVTFHDDPLRSINVTIDRIQKKTSALPRSPDLLAYQILDVLFDNYQPALDELSAELASMEHRVLTGETRDVLAEVVNLQSEVQRLRQIMAPQRDVIARMMRGEFPKVVRSQLVPYLRDLQDNLSRIGDLAETYRESLTSTLQIHLNLQQMSINRVIKVLTILATLSMPVLLVTSFYGMNIQHMPSTDWPSWKWAYLYIFGLNGLLIWLLYRFMKRHEWL